MEETTKDLKNYFNVAVIKMFTDRQLGMSLGLFIFRKF